MLVLIVVVLLGLGFAYFAAQNTLSTTVYLGSFVVRELPLYVVTLGSLLLGVLISWIISIVGGLSSYFTSFRKDVRIRDSEQKIEDLRARINALGVENARLGGSVSSGFENEVTDVGREGSFFNRLRQRFSFR